MRPRKTRKFFGCWRARHHARLDAAVPHTLATRERPEPTGQAPVAVGRLALALLLQAYGNVSDREAVALPVMAQPWQRGL